MVKVQWKGMSEVLGKFANANSNIKSNLGIALKNNAEEIKRSAVGSAPVDTGFLKSNINTSYPSDLKAEIKAGATYAGYVEYGTRKMAAQPFMRPAIEKQQSKMQKDFRDAVTRAFK